MASYVQLPRQTRSVAEQILSERQLQVFKLWMSGLSTGRIAIMLDISEPVARRTRDRAVQKVSIEMAKRRAA